MSSQTAGLAALFGPYQIILLAECVNILPRAAAQWYTDQELNLWPPSRNSQDPEHCATTAGHREDCANSCSTHHKQHQTLQFMHTQLWGVSEWHIIGHFGDDFYRPDDQTNSVKALKETSWSSISGLNHTRTIPPCYNNTTLGNRLYAQNNGPNVTSPICWTCKNYYI